MKKVLIIVILFGCFVISRDTLCYSKETSDVNINKINNNPVTVVAFTSITSSAGNDKRLYGNLKLKVDSIFDLKTVLPQYVTGIVSILMAFITIYIVYKSSKSTVDSTKLLVQSSSDNSKHDRISNLNLINRQQWINDLRIAVCEYVRYLKDIGHIIDAYEFESTTYASRKLVAPSSAAAMSDREAAELARLYDKVVLLETKINELRSNIYYFQLRIDLMLNPTPSPEEKRLINAIHDINFDKAVKFEKVIEIVDATKHILKIEWNRVKSSV